MCPKNEILRAADYHNWAEFHDGNRWQLADPYRGVFRPQTAEYVATRIIGSVDSPMGDFPCFGFRGEGLKVEMN